MLQCLLCSGPRVGAALEQATHKVLGLVAHALPVGALKVELVGEDAAPERMR